MFLKNYVIFAIVLLAVLLSACGADPTVAMEPREGEFAVDPAFREFYNHLGGDELLGPAITDALQQDGLLCQYTATALMVYNPALPESDHFKLFPLGLEMNVAEPPVPQPDDPQARYLNGHIIYPDFIPMYDRLGERFVGAPITEARYNPEQARIEQFFENMGFYHIDSDPPGLVRLLSYGLWKCDYTCRMQIPINAVPERPTMHPQLSELVERLGNDLTGFTLSAAYIANDGYIEQIFENLVLAVNPNQAGNYSLRPLPALLGISNGPLAVASGDPRLFFYRIQDDLGYNVPTYFVEYINAHGGFDLLGAPIGELYQPEGTFLRQCFTSLCLDYDSNDPNGQFVHPANQGYAYFEAFPPPLAEANSSQSAQAVTLEVSETYMTVASSQGQEISVTVKIGNQPLINAVPVLIMTLPDGSQQPYTMPPTGGDGSTLLQLPAIQAPNSTLIPYSVCLNDSSGEQFCAKDSYVIWNE